MYEWNIVLDTELSNLYSTNLSGVRIFASKYGLCTHTVRDRLKKLGIRIRSKSESNKVNNNGKGKNSSNWKGGRYIDKNGYVWIYVGNGKYRQEHILVMEKKLGRKLKIWEIVHHIDESFEARSNNDISNLQLVTRSEHNRHHMIGNINGKRKEVYNK